MGDGIRRILLCAVIAIAIALGAIAAGSTSNVVRTSVAPALAPAAGASAVADEDVSSTAWYCTSAGPATLVLSSRSTSEVSAVVTWDPAQAHSSISVPAGGQVEVPPQAKATGPQGATVALHGGSVAVSQLVTGTTGWSVSQCASSLSPTWYFAQGSTVPGNAVTLDIYDPFATPAVVDVDVITSTGETQPAAYQGLAVSPGGVVSESLDEHATNDLEFATVVQAATGSVVAEELGTVSAGSVSGLSDQLGSPEAQRLWAFPYCEAPPSGSLAFSVLNPGNSVARVVLRASDGARVAFTPLSVVVPGQSDSLMVLSVAPGFTLATPYSVVVSSNKGIVVSRTIQDPVAGALEPTEGSTSGVPVGADRWLVPAVPSPSHAATLSIQDLGIKPVKVRITKAFGDAPLVAGSPTVTVVDPGAPATVDAAALAAYAGPWVIEANGPIAVELDGYPSAISGVVVINAFVLP